MFENWRFNPFTGVMNAATITDEPHTVEYHADWNAYGIQLDEAPQLDNPSSVSIMEDVSGGDTFSEVPRTQAPEALQYRVDYDALTYYGTGRIEFNAADVGKTVLVSYKGTGWTLKNRYSVGQTVIPANLEVTEDASIDGDLTLTGDNTGKGNLKVAGDADIDGNVTIGGPTGTGDLSVCGDVQVDGALNVAGGITGALTGNADTADGVNETGSGACVIHKKIIEIGDWDMDSTTSVVVSHGLIHSKIRTINVVILLDNGHLENLSQGISDTDMTMQGYWDTPNNTQIRLKRLTGGYFDDVNHNSTSFNRGWITIEYVD